MKIDGAQFLDKITSLFKNLPKKQTKKQKDSTAQPVSAQQKDKEQEKSSSTSGANSQSKLRASFFSFIEKVELFVHAHRTLVLIVSSAAFLLLLLLLILMLFSANTKPAATKKNAKKTTAVQSVQVFEDAFVLPAEPGVLGDYYLHRQGHEKWTQEDIDTWFVAPDSEMLDHLHKSNNAVISDILGAVP